MDIEESEGKLSYVFVGILEKNVLSYNATTLH